MFDGAYHLAIHVVIPDREHDALRVDVSSVSSRNGFDVSNDIEHGRKISGTNVHVDPRGPDDLSLLQTTFYAQRREQLWRCDEIFPNAPQKRDAAFLILLPHDPGRRAACRRLQLSR
jgi:hypothetical protein